MAYNIPPPNAITDKKAQSCALLRPNRRFRSRGISIVNTGFGGMEIRSILAL